MYYLTNSFHDIRLLGDFYTCLSVTLFLQRNPSAIKVEAITHVFKLKLFTGYH